MEYFINHLQKYKQRQRENLLGLSLTSYFRFFVCLFCLGLSTLSFAETKEPPYTVVVKADNSAARTILTEHLDLITQRELEDLDEEMVGILVDETPEAAKRLLETLGFFNSKVVVNEVPGGYEVVATVGPPTIVDDVSVLLEGPILQDDSLGARYRAAMMGWRLPIDSTFTQDKWSDSKTAVLRSLTAKAFPLAKVTHSRATVNPETNTAALEMSVDSHQVIRFGEIRVAGTQRYPESIVTNMADFNYGSIYELNKLLDFQGALEQDGHFSNVVVTALFDEIKDDHVPVQAVLIEVPRQKLELGLKYDSEEGVGTHFGYTHYNVFKRGYTGSVVTDLSENEQSFSVGLSLPRGARGYYHTMSVDLKNSQVQNVRTKSGSASAWRARRKGDIESRIGFEYLLDSSNIVNGPELGDTHALLATFGWTQRKVDSMMHPRNGRLLDLSLSVTPGSVASSTALARINTRAAYYFTPEDISLGTWLARAELGYIHAEDNSKVPTSILFRTGGANTVRGYEFQSIGIPGPNSSVLGGTTVATASLEYQYPINDSVALALFHDIGDVGMQNFNDLSLKQSTGFGLRWFSPVAPLSLDIARAQEDGKWRWNLSLGLVF